VGNGEWAMVKAESMWMCVVAFKQTSFTSERPEGWICGGAGGGGIKGAGISGKSQKRNLKLQEN